MGRWRGFDPSSTSHKAIFSKAQAAGWRNPGDFTEAGKDALADAVAELNQGHAMVLAGGSAVVLKETKNGLDYIRPGDFKTFLQNRKVTVPKSQPDGQVVGKLIPLASAWLESPDRRSYDGITFAPNKDTASTYNLWHGFAVDPLPISFAQAAMKCRRLLHHIKYNLCNGNEAHFTYLMAWCADMVQRPGYKAGVSLVLRGRKGTGKSKLADILKALLGRHAFKAAKSDHIIGKFNQHLADKLLIVAEESFFAGSKADIGALKDLITSDTIAIEPKGVNAFETPSFHRVLMVTNNEWAVPASDEERRYFVLDAGEDKMQNHRYFAALDRQIFERDGLAAFFTVLSQIDLSGINLRKVPYSAALDRQKALSLEPHDSFIQDCLHSGEIGGVVWEEAGYMNKQDIYLAYVAYSRNLSVRSMPANRFCPLFEKRIGAFSIRPSQGRRCFKLPPLEKAVNHFNFQIGIRDRYETD